MIPLLSRTISKRFRDEFMIKSYTYHHYFTFFLLKLLGKVGESDGTIEWSPCNIQYALSTFYNDWLLAMSAKNVCLCLRLRVCPSTSRTIGKVMDKFL